MLEPAQTNGRGFDAFLATPGRLELRPLSRIGLPGEPLPLEFVRALQDALEIAPKEADRESLQTGPQPAFANPGAVEEDEEAEEATVRFQPDNTAPAGQSDLNKIVSSPWFWVSVGIVAAMVTGVVVGSQVE